jgi:hypothetical protein
MTTDKSTSLEQLRARVEALGHKLYTDSSADPDGGAS